VAYVECWNRIAPAGGLFIAPTSVPRSGAPAGQPSPWIGTCRQIIGFVDESGSPADPNSMGREADRDFAVEFCAAAALWRFTFAAGGSVISGPGGFLIHLKIADAYTTGSSLIRKRKNPDIAD